MNKFLLPFFFAAGLLTAACSKSADPAPAPAPTANFIPSRVVAEVNEPITLTNTSTNATRYEWRSSDSPATVITAASPVAAFSAPGNYSVTLTAFNGENKSATTTQTIHVGVRRLTEIRLTALNFLNPSGGGWNSSGGPNVYVLYGGTGATAGRTSTYNNVQQSAVPLIWTATAGTQPVYPNGNFTFTVKNQNFIFSDDTMLTGTFSTSTPSINRDALGNGSYIAGTADGKWNIVFSYQTN